LIARPTTALVSSLNPSTCNSPVTFTATISMSVPNGETVNFYDGAVSKALIGTGTTSGNVATLTTSVLASGSHTIWADYVGDANHAYSWSSSLAQTVNKVPTATLLSSSVNPSTPGALVTFTAALTPSVPNGETVTFLDGVTAIGTAKTSGGKATFGTAALGLGVHTITASYSGDANYSASVSSALSQTINQAPTVTTVASSFNASTYGAAVTFTATIAPSTPGGQTVTFYDGGSSIGTGTTSGGKAAFTTELLAVGAHSITASYPGDTTYLGSTSGVLTQTVVICHPVTTLTSSLNPSTSGASVTFTATVGPGVPNGAIVTFYDGTTSKKVVGTGTISSGTATLSTSALASGSHTIWAYYPGDSNHAYSWSGGLAQSVN